MSTASPNATASPDRHRLLSTLAGASALALPALPALAAPRHLDTELIELDAMLGAANTQALELAERCDEAYERFVPPPLPEALFWRKSDHLVIWVDRTRLDSVGEPGDERYTYASDGVLETLRAEQARWLAVEPLDHPAGDRVSARVEEIIAHLEAYQEEETRRLDACGYADAHRAESAQRKHVEELRRRIATVDARTTEGVCVKIRASLWTLDCPLWEQHRLEQLFAKSELRSSEMTELLALSAQVDAARLGAPGSCSDRRAA